jgi:glycosyltransferase involved in cell wall biosynthesis
LEGRGEAIMFSRGKRVLLVSGTSFPSINAASARISALATKLVEKGYSVRVVSPMKFPKFKQTFNSRTEEYSVLQIMPVVPFSHVLVKILNMMVAFFHAIVVLFTGALDVIILSIPPWEVALGFNLAFLLFKTHWKGRVKLVYDHRDSIGDASDYKNFLRGIYAIDKHLLGFLLRVMSIVLKQSDLIVCTTEYQKNYLIEKGFDANKIKVILNGADTKLFKPVDQKEKTTLRLKYKLPTNSFVLVVVSAGAWIYYRLEPVMAALSMLHDSRDFGEDLLLLIVGRWTRDLRTYFELAERLGIKDNVNYLGEIAHEEMPDVLNTADFGIVPYCNLSLLKETLPVKLFEYSSCELPVIVTAPNNSIIESVVQKHALGRVCLPSDVGCLTKAIEELCVNTELRNEIKRNCRIAIEKEYNRTALSEEYVILIEDVLAV